MDILTTGASLAVVIGLAEVVKRFLGDSRVAPVISILLGVAVAFLTMSGHPARETILQGIINGLSAAGLYSGTKVILKSPQTTDPLA